MKILALDQSTKLTGWSLWANGKLKKYGHLDSAIKENLPFERMRVMGSFIEDLIKTMRPDYVVLEDVQFQRNFSTYHQLSQMQGVILHILDVNHLDFTIVPPVTWKSFCKIKGKKRAEQKANTIKMVREKFNIEPTEDEADSIGIGIWASENIKEN